MGSHVRGVGTPGGTAERPAFFFADPDDFRGWLEANHDTAYELWMGLYNKRVPDRGLTWAQAVPEAFELRRDERTGIYAYEKDGQLVLPPEFAAQLAGDQRAARFFAEATATYRKIAINWVLSAAQAATREKRLAQLISDSAHGRLIPSQRYGAEPRRVERARAELDS